MFIPKRYGQYKEEKCPFCGDRAIARNRQGLNVCTKHKEEVLPDIKCACGSYLELKTGKYGPYFNCINCGNINLAKGLEMKECKFNTPQKVTVSPKEEKDQLVADSGKYKDFDYGVE